MAKPDIMWRVERVLNGTSIFEFFVWIGQPKQSRNIPYQIRCPFPLNHSHGDSHPSARIFPESNKVHCFCIKGGNRVYTWNKGTVNIEDVEEGDLVWSLSERGFERKAVEGVFVQGDKKCVEIKVVGGCTLGASFDHPVLVAKKRLVQIEPKVGPGFPPTFVSRSYFEWVQAQDIVVGDHLVGGSEFLFSQEEANEDLCKFLGFWLGDGCWSSKGNYLHLSIIDFKKELRSEYERIGLEVLPKLIPGEVVCKKYKEYIYFRGLNNSKLRELGFVGMCKTKRVPNWIWRVNRKCILAFLRGLFDSDGTVGKDGRLTFVSPSLEFLKDVQGLVDYLGLKRSSFCMSQPKGGAKSGKLYSPFYRFDVCDGREIGSDCPVKNKRIFGERKVKRKSDIEYWGGKLLEGLPSGIVLLKVREKSDLGVCSVYNLRVRGNHNFVCEGLVVHNTEARSRDVIDCVQDYFGLSFVSAIQFIEEKKGWQLDGFNKVEHQLRQAKSGNRKKSAFSLESENSVIDLVDKLRKVLSVEHMKSLNSVIIYIWDVFEDQLIRKADLSEQVKWEKWAKSMLFRELKVLKMVSEFNLSEH